MYGEQVCIEVNQKLSDIDQVLGYRIIFWLTKPLASFGENYELYLEMSKTITYCYFIRVLMHRLLAYYSIYKSALKKDF